MILFVDCVCSPTLLRGPLRDLAFFLRDLDLIYLMQCCKSLYQKEYSRLTLTQGTYKLSKICDDSIVSAYRPVFNHDLQIVPRISRIEWDVDWPVLDHDRWATWFKFVTHLKIRSRNRLFFLEELKANTHITHLDVNSSMMGMHAGMIVSKILRQNSVLHSVTLRSNRLTDLQLKPLLKSLEDNTRLTHLDLGANCFFQMSRMVCLKQKNTSLLSLHLDGCDVVFDRFHCWWWTLLDQLSLKHLDLSYNKIKWTCGFFQYLGRHNSLTSLDLSHNPFTPYCLEYLIEAVQVNGTLRSLQLNHCGIWDSRFRYISQALVSNRSLTHLSLTENHLTNEIYDVVKRLIKVNPILTRLDLRYNRECNFESFDESSFCKIVLITSHRPPLYFEKKAQEGVHPGEPLNGEEMKQLYGEDEFKILCDIENQKKVLENDAIQNALNEAQFELWCETHYQQDETEISNVQDSIQPRYP